MKKYLLPARGHFYKANLHCHTTYSDGQCTPEEIKKIYKEHGYSIVAFTDHDILIPHDNLNDEGFLALHGFETETNENKPTFSQAKTCHICYIAMKKDQLIQPNWHRTNYFFGCAGEHCSEVLFDEAKPDFVREYTPENINRMICNARKAGFFVTYNHPTWSVEDYSSYIAYEGMNAMEIFNYGCCVEGYAEYNPRVYDDMLRAGKHIFCIATDDNHNRYSVGDPRCDACGGFTVIKAKSLDYEVITDALQKGHFYASSGPAIKALWYEDGRVYVKTSPAKRIEYSTALRRCETVIAEKRAYVREASFEVRESDGYFRLTVTDRSGNHANTNAYFVAELRQ